MESVERIVWQKVKKATESIFPGNQLNFLESTVRPNYQTTIQGFSERVNEIPLFSFDSKQLFFQENNHSLIFTLNGKQLKYQTNPLQEIKKILNNPKYKNKDQNDPNKKTNYSYNYRSYDYGGYNSSNNRINITYRRINQKSDLNINKQNFNKDKNDYYNKIVKVHEAKVIKINKKEEDHLYKEIIKNIYIPVLKQRKFSSVSSSSTSSYYNRYYNDKKYGDDDDDDSSDDEDSYSESRKDGAGYNKKRIIEIIIFLNILNQLNNENIKVSPKKFISKRLSSIVNRQLDLIKPVCWGLIPHWIHELMLSEYKFLFDFQTRFKYFNRTSLGIQRTIKELEKHVDLHVEKFRNVPLPRIPRFKVRINREKNLLPQAIFIMKMPQIKMKSILEVQYYNEVGTGSGPTNEFFTLISNELRNRKIPFPIWYDTFSNSLKNDDNENENQKKKKEKKKENDVNDNQNYIYSPNGLWPLPLQNNIKTKKSILMVFEFMGTFVAKAILDKRNIELPFSLLFWKYILRHNPKFSDLQYIVPDLYKFLKDCKKLIKRKKRGEENILYNGIELQDLFITFTLPGYPKFELIQNGGNTFLNINNLEKYVNLIVDYFLNSGIKKQLNAFTKGYNKIMPISHLNVFNYQEIDLLVNGEIEKWTDKLLLNSIICDHGYNKDSKIVKWLVQVLSNFNNDQKKAFIKFCTGSSRLPVGGIAKLNPKLTIVKSDRFFNTDSRLPTCMTCVNFLKIPPYSSKNILKVKLLQAINEGQDSFHLS